ncbi:phage tail assembly chaperone [Rhodobacter sp. CCP-1]|uniref:Phage tail assembly chaperone n=2 Tax=Paragemmobacter ruber TaxID=1985673 RepID=A0ABW9Y839_9RHOB|nr:rcc01693 family protein [Rhodobacter ruber]NBE08680.1 phage tail assembly chaperone [Rhodobacter ruber]
MRAGIGGLRLDPALFWRLTPAELRLMLGLEVAVPPLTRARLAELVAAFPDGGMTDGGSGGAGGAGGADGGGAAGGGGL